MHKRTRKTLYVVAGVVVVLALAIFLRSKAPPEAARLLPECDGILYFNLKPMHTFLHKVLRPPRREPEYQQFIDITGIDWERDLDQAAIALHRMPDPNGPNGPVAYSMVLVGRLTGSRLNNWLNSHARSRETYEGHTIFAIPSENRTVRVSQVGYDMVAVSNTPTPEQIHAMIDRHRTAALPFAGSTMLREHFYEVPLLALGWGVGQIASPFNESGGISILGLQIPIESDSTFVASVSPELSLAGALRVRIEQITPDADTAEKQAGTLATLVTLARGFSAPLADNTANRGLKDLLKTAEVTQKRNRVVIVATLPTSSLADLAAQQDEIANPPETGVAQ